MFTDEEVDNILDHILSLDPYWQTKEWQRYKRADLVLYDALYSKFLRRKANIEKAN